MSSSTVKYVDHTYRDFSRYVDEGGQLIKHKKSEGNFPAKLHKMLSNPTHSDVITWMPHGRAWKILDKDLLFSSVLPQYYVCKKFESFTRQLNGWGFKRLYQSGSDLGCYYHECFLRSLPKLTCLIRRLSPNQGKSTPYPSGEPNFYRVSEKYPVPSSTLSDASAKSPAAEATTATGLIEDMPSLDSPYEVQYTQPPSAHPPTQYPSSGLKSAAPTAWLDGHSYEHSAHESMEVLAAAASSATPSREHSNEFQYPSLSSMPPLSEEYSVGFAASTAIPYEPPHLMPQYAQDYAHHHHPGPNSYSHAHSYSTNYPPTVGNYSQTQGSSHGQYSSQAQPPQYQFQPSEPRRFRYPPPELPRYQYPPPPNYHYPFANVASINEHFPQSSHRHFEESNFNAGPPVPLPFDGNVRQDGNVELPGWTPGKELRGSPLIEPLPYYSRLVENVVERDSSVHKRIDPPGSGIDSSPGSPVHKRQRDDPP